MNRETETPSTPETGATAVSEPPASSEADPSLEEEIREAFIPSRASRIASGFWMLLILVGVAFGGAFFHEWILPGSGSGGGGGGGGASTAASPAASEPGAEPEEKTKYTCGMHPHIVMDEPGSCPVCGMKLTPVRSKKKKSGKKKIVTGKVACKGRKILWYQAPMNAAYRSPKPGKSPMGMDLLPACESDEEASEEGIEIESRVRQNMGIRTMAVQRGPLEKDIRTVGHVDYDERKLAIINTKIDGWVESLYVDYTGQIVKKGQRLLSLYSPQLISTQEELILAVRQYKISKAQRDKTLVDAAERRLRYWDISRGQIARIKRTGKIQRTLAIHAPMAGVVTHKTAFDGKFVKAGMDLFKIADLSTVWVYAHIYEQDVPFVHEGDHVVLKLPYSPGKVVEGRVDYIFPWLDKKTRDVKVRLVFDNPDGHLKPDMYATVQLHAKLAEEVTLVDDAAVIRSGTRNVAFVEVEPGIYQPRNLVLGRAGDGVIEVLKGLKAGEQVVVNGQFMLDSESRLKEALKKFDKGSGDDGAATKEPAKDPGSHEGHNHPAKTPEAK